MALSQAPLTDVTVTITSDNTAVTIDGPDSDATFSSSETLTFTTTDYATTQDVRYQAPADDDATGEEVTLTHTAAGVTPGTRSGYDGVTATQTIRVTDDDEPGITLSETTALAVREENASPVTYTVVLDTEPTADVTVTVTAPAGLEIDDNNDNDFGTTETLTFAGGSSGNWDTAQTIRVNALADDNVAPETTAITHVVTSTDTAYNAVGDESLTVNVTDSDTAAIVLATTTLTITEGGSDTYTVKLSNEPSAEVTVTITSPADDDVTISTDGSTFSNHPNTPNTCLLYTSPSPRD